jgi:hypothetical protein
LQAMGGGDDAPGSTPHAYIGKSWRLRWGMGACVTTGCKDLINVVGAILGNICMHAWMVVWVQMLMHVPRRGSYSSCAQI